LGGEKTVLRESTTFPGKKGGKRGNPGKKELYEDREPGMKIVRGVLKARYREASRGTLRRREEGSRSSVLGSKKKTAL